MDVTVCRPGRPGKSWCGLDEDAEGNGHTADGDRVDHHVPRTLWCRSTARRGAVTFASSPCTTIRLRIPGSDFGKAPVGTIPPERRRADLAHRFEPHLAHLDFREGWVLIGIAVYDDAEIRLVHPVRGPADVVQGRDRAGAVTVALNFCRMRDEPDMHPVVLGEAFHFSEKLRNVLGLGHVDRAPML